MPPDVSIEIRDATVADLTGVFNIYNVEVEHGIATFGVEPKVAERDAGWLTERDEIHPVIVAVDRDEVVGWASLSPWSTKGAYLRTAEVSVYVDASRRGERIGALLLSEAVGRARGTVVKVILARIALPNPSSIAIHEALGFHSIGTQRRCGEKLGKVLDVELMDLHLD